MTVITQMYEPQYMRQHIWSHCSALVSIINTSSCVWFWHISKTWIEWRKFTIELWRLTKVLQICSVLSRLKKTGLICFVLFGFVGFFPKEKGHVLAIHKQTKKWAIYEQTKRESRILSPWCNTFCWKTQVKGLKLQQDWPMTIRLAIEEADCF